jgi:hypothetical protein
MALADDVASIATQRSNLLAALTADSINPQPSYSVGGQSVSRSEWRESLLRQVADLNKMAQILNPLEIRAQIY